MSVSQPFQIDAEEVERTSLEPTDIGLWAILITGCYHLYETEAGASRLCLSYAGRDRLMTRASETTDWRAQLGFVNLVFQIPKTTTLVLHPHFQT